MIALHILLYIKFSYVCELLCNLFSNFIDLFACFLTKTFKLWYWRRLESPLDCREIKPVNPRGYQPRIFIWGTVVKAETPILWPPDVRSWLIGKDPDAGKDWRQKEKGEAEEEMVREHQQLNGHEFEQTPGDSGGQRILACCGLWSHKESDTT